MKLVGGLEFMRKHTTMRITNTTLDRLKDLRYTQSESMENVIIRLLEAKCGAEEVFYLIKSNDDEFQLKISVDWTELEENLYYYDEEGRKYTQPPTPDFTDDAEKERYEAFIEHIMDIPNIHAMLLILAEGQYIRAGDLIIGRL